MLIKISYSKFRQCFGQNAILFTAGEDKNITGWDTKSGKVAYVIEDAHSTRIKGLVVLSRSDGAMGEEDPYLLASASSDGVIRVWDVRMANKEKSVPLTEVKTKSRLTCLAGSSFRCEYNLCYLNFILWLLACSFSYRKWSLIVFGVLLVLTYHQ